MPIRGSNIITGTGSSLTVALPSGSAVGDLAILFSNSGWIPFVPSGWTTLASASSSQWSQIQAYKVLTSGDISTGSVTVSFSNAFDCVLGLVVFVGSPAMRESESCSNTFGALPNTTTSAVLAGETAIYWSSQRGNAVPTITPASGSPTTLQTGTTTNGGSILAYQAMPGGALAVNTTFVGAFWVAYQIIIETPPTGNLLTNPGMDGGMHPQLKGGLNG